MSWRDHMLAQTRYAGRQSASDAAKEKARDKETAQNPPKGRILGRLAKNGNSLEAWYEEYRQTPKSQARRTPEQRSRGAREAADQAEWKY